MAKNVMNRLRHVGYGAGLAVLASPLMMSAAHAEMKKAPKEMCDGMDTFIGWFQYFAGGLAVVGLIIIGVGMWFSHQHNGPMRLVERILFWIGGCVCVGAAVSIAAVFVSRGTIC
ncbi:TrbC/VirB2 family protein [Rothia dentocariosa]|uniref:TrbC/VirB2 family protein n=1 Tax=Rothia dentocariosa TaxID=2047 RepID=UPI0028E6D2B2|nr:TrbC/VirB2 family protein [Rothia dentocariosa]